MSAETRDLKRRLVASWALITLLWFIIALDRAGEGAWGWFAWDVFMCALSASVAFANWKESR